MMEQVWMQVQQRAGGPPGGPLFFGITLVSTGLLLALITVFFTTWRRTRAPFMLGLLVFSSVLLLQDVAHVARTFGFGSRSLDVLPELLEVVALVVLLYLATR